MPRAAGRARHSASLSERPQIEPLASHIVGIGSHAAGGEEREEVLLARLSEGKAIERQGLSKALPALVVALSGIARMCRSMAAGPG